MSAALEFVDEHGMEPLTMRALGERMGVDPTAVYRHYPNKEDLVLAVCDKVLGCIIDRIGPPIESPRENTLHIAMVTRSVYREHPHIMNAIVTSTGYMENGFFLSRQVARSLLTLGVRKEKVAVAYQMLEGFLMGACLMDFTSSPHNFAIRRARYRALDLPEFDAVSADEAAVQRIADEAFITGLDRIIDASLLL